ncbi:hypothetical protein ACFV4P_34345 [Kitasatospora sp. NPDC059795]|uniref:hypothetical protein n=1 Tax=Kitasatospora sp. NPDC059795 TaxID=3346949 RepID=UPI003649FD7D
MERMAGPARDRKPKGTTFDEVAEAAGVSQYTVSAIARIASVPRLGPRSGLNPQTANRMAAAIRAGLLNEKAARAFAADPDGFYTAIRELTALLGEISDTKQKRAA